MPQDTDNPIIPPLSGCPLPLPRRVMRNEIEDEDRWWKQCPFAKGDKAWDPARVTGHAAGNIIGNWYGAWLIGHLRAHPRMQVGERLPEIVAAMIGRKLKSVEYGFFHALGQFIADREIYIDNGFAAILDGEPTNHIPTPHDGAAP
jgi:hypothetical protein